MVKGRSDKKFCNDFCRNAFNNKLNCDQNNYMRNVNNILRRNRRILKKLFPASEEMVRITKQKLNSKGFLPEYFTHTTTTKRGKMYYCCYDYAYQPLKSGSCVVIKTRFHAKMPS